MNYESIETVPSNLPAFSGVVFLIRKPTEKLRIEWDIKVADHVVRIQDIQREVSLVETDGDTPAALEKLRRLAFEQDTIIHKHLNPAWLEVWLAGVDGLTIDGREITPEMLFAEGPPELCREAIKVIQARARGLSEAEAKNSELPSTSGAPVDGNERSTGAPSASETGTT